MHHLLIIKKYTKDKFPTCLCSGHPSVTDNRPSWTWSLFGVEDHKDLCPLTWGLENADEKTNN